MSERRKIYIVSYSGGIGSFVAAFRLKYEWKVADEIRLVFTDTLIEDEDLYRFLVESARLLELPLIWLADGRTPWEVFRDEKYQGNSRKAPCSKLLKRAVMTRYVKEQQTLNPDADFVLVLGIDYEEAHRLERAQKNNSHCEVIAPLCDTPYISADARERLVHHFGMEVPRLYRLGFPHNNCGGFCVRAGLAQFALLRKEMPERYEHHSKEQKKLVAQNPSLDHPFLKKTINGVRRYVSLEELDQMLAESELKAEEKHDFGGCGCFVDDTEVEA